MIIPAEKEEAPAKVEEAEAIPEETAEDIAAEEIPKEQQETETPEKAAEEKPTANHEKQRTEKNKEKTAKKHSPKEKNITIKSVGFQRDAFEAIGAEIISEEGNKIIMEYSGDLGDLAKLLYDLNMDDICISSKDLQEEFLPFYEGGGKA